MNNPLVENVLQNLIPANVACMFMMPWEMFQSTLAIYAGVDDPSELVDVPGDQRQCRVSSDRVRCSTAGLLCWWMRLHKNDFSLNGLDAGPDADHLPADAFVVDLNGMVKGSHQMFHRLVPVNDALRTRDMQRLAHFARDHLYRVPQFPDVPPMVLSLFTCLNNFQPDEYVLLKTHPALLDAIDLSALFTKLYALLLAMKKRNKAAFTTVMAAMEPDIASPDWVFNALQNNFLHQLIRFSSSPTNSLCNSIQSFLSNSLKVGNGRGESCLRVRRNGEAHLIQDYSSAPKKRAVEVGFRAAIRAVQLRMPDVVPVPNLPNPPLANVMLAPFTNGEARAIAIAITKALSQYKNSVHQAEAAAIAAATHLCNAGKIHTRPRGLPMRKRKRKANLHQKQQLEAQTEATIAAVAAQHQQQAQPFVDRTLFDVKDACNMLTLLEPEAACTLHREMFNAGELQNIEWHWDRKDHNLSD